MARRSSLVGSRTMRALWLGLALATVCAGHDVLLVHNQPSDGIILPMVTKAFASHKELFVEEDGAYYHCSRTTLQYGHTIKLIIYIAEGEMNRCAFNVHVPVVQILTHRREFVVHFPDDTSTDRQHLTVNAVRNAILLITYKSEKFIPSPVGWLNTLFTLAIGAVIAYVYAKKYEKRLLVKWFPKTKYGSRDEMLVVNSNQFRIYMEKMVDLIIDYHHNNHKYKVWPTEEPGFFFNKMPRSPPEEPESFGAVIKDVKEKILPGLLHWQHPRFHGFFMTGFSYADVLGEALVSGLSSHHFSWDAGPSVTELEVVVVNWVAQALDLPKAFHFDLDNAANSKGGGCLQNSASDAIIVSVLTSRRVAIARQLKRIFGKDLDKVDDEQRIRVTYEIMSKMVCYYSDQAHSSIEKACMLSAVRAHVIRADTRDFAVHAYQLEEAIQQDLENGSTNLGLADPVRELANVARRYKMWVHVDGAYGGSAMILPEYRKMFDGLELAHSVNVNMHKMMLMSATASLFWSRRQRDIVRTFSIEPEYLKKCGGKVGVHDFRHWGTNLSKRAFAVPIWFTIRMFGMENIRNYIRRMIHLRKVAQGLIKKDNRFAFVGIPSLTLFGFRLNIRDRQQSNKLTKGLCEFINRSGRLYFTYAKPMDIGTIRFSISHQLSQDDDIKESYDILCDLTDQYLSDVPEYQVFKSVNNLPMTRHISAKPLGMDMSYADVTSASRTPTHENQPSEKTSSCALIKIPSRARSRPSVTPKNVARTPSNTTLGEMKEAVEIRQN